MYEQKKQERAQQGELLKSRDCTFHPEVHPNPLKRKQSAQSDLHKIQTENSNTLEKRRKFFKPVIPIPKKIELQASEARLVSIEEIESEAERI